METGKSHEKPADPRPPGERPVWSPSPGDLAAQEIAALGEDAEGRVWFATHFGDWGWWQDGVVERFPIADVNNSRSRATLFLRTRAGDFRVGTNDGLLRLQPDGTFAGLERDRLPHPQVLSACEDIEGALWVGTGRGLSRYRDGLLESYIDLEPRAIEVVTALQADADGEVRMESAPGQGARFLVRILLTETNPQRKPTPASDGGRE